MAISRAQALLIVIGDPFLLSQVSGSVAIHTHTKSHDELTKVSTYQLVTLVFPNTYYLLYYPSICWLLNDVKNPLLSPPSLFLSSLLSHAGPPLVQVGPVCSREQCLYWLPPTSPRPSHNTLSSPEFSHCSSFSLGCHSSLPPI